MNFAKDASVCSMHAIRVDIHFVLFYQLIYDSLKIINILKIIISNYFSVIVNFSLSKFVRSIII